MAEAGPESIAVKNIVGTGSSDSYIIQWAPVNDLQAVTDPAALQWTQSPPVPTSAEEMSHYTIEGLIPEQGYIIAVIAMKGPKSGEPVYFSDNYVSSSIENAKILYPHKIGFFDAVPDFTAASGSANSITVSRLYTPQVRRYRLYWREKGAGSDTPWQRLDINAEGDGQQGYNPVSYTIEGLKPWATYYVRACPLSMSGLEGFNAVMDLSTQGGDFVAELSASTNPLSLGIQFNSLPVGTTGSAEIYAKIRYQKHTADLLYWQAGWPLPLIIPIWEAVETSVSFSTSARNYIGVYYDNYECKDITICAFVVVRNQYGSVRTLTLDRSF